MARLLRSLLLLTALLITVGGRAQVVNAHELVPDSTLTYRFELRDGSVVQGSVVATDTEAITVRTAQMGDVKLVRTAVQQVVRLDGTTLVAGQYWFPNPHDTRHLIGPSAIPLRRGEGYYQNTYLLLNGFAVGVSNNISIGGGIELISTFSPNGGGPIFYGTIKGSGEVTKNLYVGAAGAILSLPDWFGDDDPRSSVGALTGLVTYGTSDRQVTGGMGWSHSNGEFAKRPIFTVSTLLRMSRRTAFVSENWIVPENEGYYGVFSYGLRFMGEKIAVDLAFINNKDIMEGIVIGIPFIDFAVKF